MIETAVSLSGLTKQDYILHRLQEKEIVVQGKLRVYTVLKDELRKVLEELQRIETGKSVIEDLLEGITLLAETMSGMKEETEWRRE